MSTEDNLSEIQNSVLNIVKANPGISFNDLCSKAGIDDLDAAKALHVLTSRVLIYKNKTSYFHVDVDIEAVVNTPEKKKKEAANQCPTELVARTSSDTKCSEIVVEAAQHSTEEPKPVKEVKLPPKPVERKFGNFRRSSTLGVVALFLYANRPVAFSSAYVDSKLENFVNASAASALYKLAADGFAEAVGEGHRKSYKWSGVFTYPFSKMLPEDDLLIKKIMSDKSSTVDDSPKTEIPVEVEQPSSFVSVPLEQVSVACMCSVMSDKQMSLARLNARIHAAQVELADMLILKSALEFALGA